MPMAGEEKFEQCHNFICHGLASEASLTSQIFRYSFNVVPVASGNLNDLASSLSEGHHLYA